MSLTSVSSISSVSNSAPSSHINDRSFEGSTSNQRDISRTHDRFFLVFAPAVEPLALALALDAAGIDARVDFLALADGFCGDSGSGDDDPTDDTADSRDDRRVIRGVSAWLTTFDTRDLRGLREGVGNGARPSSSSSSSVWCWCCSASSDSASESMSAPGMLRRRSFSLTTFRRTDDLLGAGCGSGSGSGSVCSSGSGSGDGSRAPRRSAVVLRVRLPVLALPFATLVAETDWLSSSTFFPPCSSSSSGRNAPGGSIASVSVRAMRAPLFVAILRVCTLLPKTDTENSPDTSMSALLSRARATEADSFARAESLSDRSESMLTSRSCGPVIDVSAAPDFLPDREDFAEADAEAADVGTGCAERLANADTGGVAGGVGRAREPNRFGRFVPADVGG